jgi:hypothetical protein
MKCGICEESFEYSPEQRNGMSFGQVSPIKNSDAYTYTPVIEICICKKCYMKVLSSLADIIIDSKPKKEEKK